jgi:hypothetical protein
MIDDQCRAVGGMRIGRGSLSTRRKSAPMPLWPPQITHDLTWDRTRAATVGSRRLTAWAMARPLCSPTFPLAVWPRRTLTSFTTDAHCSLLFSFCIRLVAVSVWALPLLRSQKGFSHCNLDQSKWTPQPLQSSTVFSFHVGNRLLRALPKPLWPLETAPIILVHGVSAAITGDFVHYNSVVLIPQLSCSVTGLYIHLPQKFPVFM